MHEAIILMKFNLKDVVILLQLIIIAVIYFTGTMLTTRQTRTVKGIAKNVMNGAIISELATVLLWVFCTMQ